ncbi:hypothetical protein C8Q73DRAFT_753534, partial [Cubamyces lactineus]
ASHPDKAYKGQPFEHVVRFLAYLAWGTWPIPSSNRTDFSTYIFAYSGRLLHYHRSLPQSCLPATLSSPRSHLCSAQPTRTLKHVSPRFFIGPIPVLGGSSYRLWAFHPLGELFAYELSI